MHISTACPGGTPPGQPGGNEGEFGILSVYSAREPRGNYKLCNNRTTGGGGGGGEVGDFCQIKTNARAPARFPVLKGPIRRQTVRAKQAGHFPLFKHKGLYSCLSQILSFNMELFIIILSRSSFYEVP